ncbi:Undecaprenyl-phosphate mannosyltransferase [BD1-7 clade bacterium]|uniref:Undecaprenyl-phosphate mannosyltransferase n=1 Tax=BD1-7 clade bacterium TaxID=2029982 RepID=A0A5S9QJR4_9GAMM|nr:Undecaprenyl-phosphate mannosyltransferase [BD1-7 clade bacterium]CAA0119114.1 Undecaprenyl-phosphate mannosyltransferase [BD1-7 clade bacterium]
MTEPTICVVIPVYNHEHAIGITVNRILERDLTVILVDDGSEPGCAKVLRTLADEHADVILEVHPQNRGKGGAVKTGLTIAEKRGFTHALQVDADGQHDTADIPRFIDACRQRPDALICGIPDYDETVPRHRLIARYLTHVWVWINTLSLDIKDSMCGYRVYPLIATNRMLERIYTGERMNFDVEVLVKLHWENVPIVNLPTKVQYPIDGVSHFNLLQDNLLITAMHTRLFFGMLVRLPKILVQNTRRKLSAEGNH